MSGYGTNSFLHGLKGLTMKALGVSILFGFFAGWIIFFGALNELHKMESAKHWDTRRGTITHSYPRHVRRVFRKGLNWEAEIAGKYLGTGQKFSVDRVGYGVEHSTFTRRQAEAVIARYPVGTEVDVYVDKQRPSRGILVRNNSSKPTQIALVIGLAFGLLPFILYLLGKLRSKY